MIAWLLASSAFALDPMCAQAFTDDAWKTYMDTADAAFAASETSKARVALDSARELIPCLDAPPKPELLGRYAQQRAILAFFDQDETAAVHWGMVHRFVSPDLAWPFPDDHPLASLLSETEDPPVGKGDGWWLTEKGQTVFLNGRPVYLPEARAEVPQVVQIYDKNGVVVRSFWQDGAAFPSDLVGPLGGGIGMPEEWWTGPVPEAPPEGTMPPIGKQKDPNAKGGSGDVPLVQMGVEVGFPTGVRVEAHPADTLRVGARVGGTFEPMNIADGAQGTVYGGALAGMAVAGPVGVELTAGLQYTWGGEYDTWNEAFEIGHAMPLVGLDGTFDLGDKFRIVAGCRAAFGGFVWIAPEAQLVLLF